jgi:hypothetical protein
MMMSNETKQVPQRRRFLAALGIGGLATAAIVATPRRAAAMKPEGGKAGPHYRESDHVKKYYQVNRY